MVYIVVRVLNETKPMWYYILAACLFILSQLSWFLLGRVICKVEKSLPHFVCNRIVYRLYNRARKEKRMAQSLRPS